MKAGQLRKNAGPRLGVLRLFGRTGPSQI